MLEEYTEISRAVANVLEADPDFLLRHGYTYSGHPAGSAAVIANMLRAQP